MSGTKQVSAGFVVFREIPEREFLLLAHDEEYWNFPKGKTEQGETELEAAYRELKEETSLADVEVIPGFREVNEYSFEFGGETIEKEAVFFLSKLRSGEVRLSAEHIDFKWLKLEEAVKRVKFENARKLLRDADESLSKM